MKRLTVLLCFFTLISCQDKVICPAYQSTYILDDKTRNAYFSYAWQLDEEARSQYLTQQLSGDSTSTDSLSAVAQPKTDYYAHAGEYVVPWRPGKKTKYGIVKPVFYPVKKYRMRTAPMENVFAPDPLSNEFEAEEFGLDTLQSDTLNFVAVDSLAIDSMVVAQEVAEESKPKKDEVRFLYGYDPADNFNVEQLYYNKHFGDRLIDSRPKPEPKEVASDTLATAVETDSTSTEKQPLFKGLFKKKGRSNTETTAEDGVENSEVGSETVPEQEPEQEQPDGDGGQV